MRISLDRFEANYEEWGTGAPLVLVHGLGGSTAIWQKVAGPLSQHYRVIAYDLRGLGRSTTPAPPYSMADLVSDLHGLLAVLGLERVALVGHSLGGAIVLAFAIEHPEHVTSVVAVAPPSFTPPNRQEWLADHGRSAQTDGMERIAEVHAQNGLPEAFRLGCPEDTAAYKQVLASGDPEGFAAHCAVIAALDLTSDLDRIASPVLVLEGELDQVVPAKAVRETAAAIPGCRYVELEGCGHVVPFERAEELVARVREFVA